MDMEMRGVRRLPLRGRSGLSLVEVLIAIVVIAVALGAVLNVFSHSLRLTTESALNSKGLVEAYAQVQKSFFVENLSSPPSGVRAVAVSGTVNVVFSGSGTLPGPLPLRRYDVGTRWPLRVYRP